MNRIPDARGRPEQQDTKARLSMMGRARLARSAMRPRGNCGRGGKHTGQLQSSSRGVSLTTLRGLEPAIAAARRLACTLPRAELARCTHTKLSHSIDPNPLSSKTGRGCRRSTGRRSNAVGHQGRWQRSAARRGYDRSSSCRRGRRLCAGAQREPSPIRSGGLRSPEAHRRWGESLSSIAARTGGV